MKTPPSIMLLFQIVTVVFSLNAEQQIKISGRVLNADSTPVPDAKIRLTVAGIEAESDSNGSFQLVGELKVIPKRFSGTASLPIGFNGTILTFSVSEKTEKVVIEVYNVLGKRTGVIIDQYFETGVYTCNPLAVSSRLLAKGFYLLRVRVGNETKTFKLSGVHFVVQSGNSTLSRTTAALQKKKGNEITDTLVISKGGYYSQSIEIRSYSEELGIIQLAQTPQIPETNNVGNDDVIILPISSINITDKIDISNFDESKLTKPFANDDLLSNPVTLTNNDKIEDPSGFIVRLPLQKITINNPNVLTIFAILQDSKNYSIQHYGFLTGDTLNFYLKEIGSNLTLAAAQNPGMITINMDNSLLESKYGLEKKKETTTNWPTFNWWCTYDSKDVDLMKAAAEHYDKDINEMIISTLIEPAFAISKEYNRLGFRAPDFDLINDPPRTILGNGLKVDQYEGQFYRVHLTSNWLRMDTRLRTSAVLEKLHEFIGITLSAYLFNKNDINKEMGTIKGFFAHELMHGIISGYEKDDIFKRNPANAYNASSIYHDAIATLCGHTIDHHIEKDEGIFVRPSPLIFEGPTPDDNIYRYTTYLLDIPFLQQNIELKDIDIDGKKYTFKSIYAYHDYFAYIAKKYKNNSIAFLHDMLETIRGDCSQLQGNESYDDYVMINLKAVNKYFENSLWKCYAEFIENRAYEHNAESSLRDKDKDDWEGVWKLRKDLFTESTTIPSFKDIPSFASRYITLAIPPESFDTTTFVLISAKTVPIQLDSLRIVYYPESSERTGKKDNKIIFDRKVHGWNIDDGHNVDTVILALNDFKDSNGGLYGTFLLMNCSYRSVDNVSLQLLNKPLIKIAFDDHNNRKVPAVIDFEPKIMPPDFPLKNDTWIFSDNDISFLKTPTNLYAKQGTYNVSLTCETPDGTALKCSTTIKIDPYDIVTTYNIRQSGECEGAVCDNDISGKGKGILFDYGTILSNFDATFEFSIGGGNSDCESVCTLFIAPEGGDWDILWSTTGGRTAKSNTTYSGHIYNEDRSFTYLAAYAPSCGMELLDFTAHLKPTSFFYVSKTDAVAGETITFEADCIPLPLENKDPEVIKIISCQWDFGDGKYISTTDLKVSHVYSVPEKYQVTLFITDEQGGNDYRTEIVNVSEK